MMSVERATVSISPDSVSALRMWTVRTVTGVQGTIGALLPAR